MGEAPDQLVFRSGTEEPRDLFDRREGIGPRERQGRDRDQQKDRRLEVLEDDDREESPRKLPLVVHCGYRGGDRIRLPAS